MSFISPPDTASQRIRVFLSIMYSSKQLSHHTIVTVCSDEGLTLETSANHHIPQATNMPYQPLLIKPIFSVLAHAEKQFFAKLVFELSHWPGSVFYCSSTLFLHQKMLYISEIFSQPRTFRWKSCFFTTLYH